MKIIFLDIDGVLNNEPHALELHKLVEEGKMSSKEFYDTWDLPYDDTALPLKHIVDETGAKIVLSSSWRVLSKEVEKLSKKLKEYNLEIMDKTCYCVSLDKAIELGCDPSKSYFGKEIYEGKRTILSDRGIEITEWLSRHPEVESYVILDDEDCDIVQFHPNKLVKTEFYGNGLTMDLAEKAIDILGGKLNEIRNDSN